MKIASPVRFVSSALAALALLMGAVGAEARSSAQAASSAADIYYERALVLAAHRQCRLFEPGLTAALDAATLQARGAALRAGGSGPDLAAVAARAQARAQATACDDAGLKRVTARVRTAFAGWSRAALIEFAGGAAPWKADRFSGREPGWRLAQDGAVGASPVRFGLSGRGPATTEATAVVSFVGRPRPYAARLVMRDAAKAPRPWLAKDGLPPEAARRAVFAARSEAAPRSLLAEGARRGEAWIFPAEAAEALAGLDPREPFLIEFLFRDDSVATARFTTGDFAAGRAFLAMGPL
ncbi:hypothetical protein D3C73_478870 [compost metagenome]